MLLPLWALATLALAEERSIIVQSSVAACASLVSEISWDYPDAEFYGAVCLYEPAIGSWVTCIDDFLQDHDLQLIADIEEECCASISHRCQSLNDFESFDVDTYVSSLANASQYFVDELPAERARTVPIKFDTVERHAVGNAWVVNLKNLSASNASSMYIYSFLVVASLLAGIAHHLSSVVFRKKPINRIRSLLTLPTLSHRHAQPITKAPGGLVPTRLELGLIVGVLAAHAIALCYKYEFDDGEAIEDKRMQLLKYAGYRTGLLAFAQCPLIIFFSGRNSMFELATGLHYSTSIVLHKWISRLMTLDAFIHGAIFIYRAYLGGYLEHATQSRFWICGALTLYASIILCVLAFGMLRHRWYEFFLVTHILFAMAFFYYGWQHVKNLGWAGWIYASVGLWITEKALRLTRVAVFGGVISAHAELYNPDIIRVTIPKPRKGWTTHPGQYVFVYFLFPKYWWQSHPFTFVDLGDSIVLVIKSKKGVTSALLERVKENGGRADVLVCVEGPYGDSASISGFEGKLFVCGGSGIPGPLSYVLNTPKPNMLLVIVVRDLDILTAFKTEISALPETSVQIYVTSSGAVHGSINDVEWDGRKNLVRGRRPDIVAIVHEYLDRAESLAITCCGPPALVDMTRDLTASALRSNPTKCVAYFEEYQTW